MKPFFRCLIVLVSLLGFAGAARCQTTVVQRPDCFLPFGPLTAASAGTSAGPFDNRTLGCDTWKIDYNSFGFTVISILVQVAPNATGNVPGAWATYAPIAPGINPNTATTQAVTLFGSTASGSTTAYFPWLRVQLTTATGTGSVSGVLYGWKTPAGSTTTACPGTVATPCVVVGPTAAGSPATTSPVLIAGQDGAPGNIRVVRVDTTGHLDPAGLATAQADGVTNTPTLPAASGAAETERTYPYKFNGSTWDRDFVCPLRAMVTLTDTTLTALVAVSGSTVVRACHIHATTGTAETISIVQGTGVACAGATATIDSYVGVVAFSTDYGQWGALRTSASNGLCVQQTGTQTAVVWVAYAQY